jgi:hypothetical protein
MIVIVAGSPARAIKNIDDLKCAPAFFKNLMFGCRIEKADFEEIFFPVTFLNGKSFVKMAKMGFKFSNLIGKRSRNKF